MSRCDSKLTDIFIIYLADGFYIISLRLTCSETLKGTSSPLLDLSFLLHTLIKKMYKLSTSVFQTAHSSFQAEFQVFFISLFTMT